MLLDRRAAMAASAAATGASLITKAQAQTPPTPDVTRLLARYVTSARFEDLPENVRREGRRTLLNYVGVAVGGSRHETVDRALKAISPFSGKPEANVLGRRERLDILNAALVNGILVHGTGTEVTAPEVIANLGSNGPNIVHFNGTTDDPATDDLRLQGGSGQADVTGAEITLGGNPEGYDLLTTNIFLTGHIGMDWIEFALTGADGTNGGTVDFFITLNGSNANIP